jgi:hypothetical protein
LWIALLRQLLDALVVLGDLLAQRFQRHQQRLQRTLQFRTQAFGFFRIHIAHIASAQPLPVALGQPAGTVRDFDTMRTSGEHRRLLHLRSVGDDTDTLINKKHCRRKPYKSQSGASLAACNAQSIVVAQENRKCRLLRQRNEL